MSSKASSEKFLSSDPSKGCHEIFVVVVIRKRIKDF